MVNGALGDDFTGTWAHVVKTKSWTTTLDAGWNAKNCEMSIRLFQYSGRNSKSQCAVLQTSKLTTDVNNTVKLERV
jgi:hypothetical protein